MKYRTIIIDDDPIIVMIMKKILIKNSFDSAPLAFYNGKSALNYFKDTYTIREKYVLFLDINMPVMNGWEFLNQIKDIANPENTFIFIVSSSINPADQQKANKNELVLKFISKPVLEKTVLKIKEIIEEKF